MSDDLFDVATQMMEANGEATDRLIHLLRMLWQHAEGISDEDIKLLCWGCNIDSSTVMTQEPPPPTGQWDSSMEMPF